MIDRAIDHVAIVVKNLDAMVDLYTNKLGFSIAYRETVEDQGVRIVGVAAGESVIELLEPISEDSPIAKFRGDAESKMHHTAYQVTDIKGELAKLKARGVRLIDEVPRKGAHGNMIAFLHPKSTAGVLVELCQRTH